MLESITEALKFNSCDAVADYVKIVWNTKMDPDLVFIHITNGLFSKLRNLVGSSPPLEIGLQKGPPIV
uniref:Uncharacterized protein n=1 Tax=Cucumis melo TaxID=3656 RepID=A0A9I9EE61_CUCME